MRSDGFATFRKVREAVMSEHTAGPHDRASSSNSPRSRRFRTDHRTRHPNVATMWPAIVDDIKAMQRLQQRAPAIQDLAQHLAEGVALGRKASRADAKARTRLYEALQFAGETYVRIWGDAAL